MNNTWFKVKWHSETGELMSSRLLGYSAAVKLADDMQAIGFIAWVEDSENNKVY